MNRLTERINDKVYYAKGKYAPTTLCSEMETWDVRECMKKLAAYEVTGLEPEEIQQLNASDASKEESSIKYYNEMRKYRDELKYYKKLEEQGLLIKLPCKVGDTVYLIHEVARCTPTIEPVKFGIALYNYFGKTVFLTQAEAERALEASNGERT